MPTNSHTSGVGRFFSAANDYTTSGQSGVQNFAIDLNNTYEFVNKSLLAQIYQSYTNRTITTATSDDINVTQRFVFGAWVDNPLELISMKTAEAITGVRGALGVSYIKANNFISYSDVRLKTNIETLNENHGVDKIRAVQYNSVSDNSKHFGVIAHELEEIYPELVMGGKGKEDMQSVSYVELIPLCINEIQLLKKENRSLHARLEALESNYFLHTNK